MPVLALVTRCRELLRSDQMVLALLAAVTGVLVAYAAIGFRLAIDGVQWLGFGFAGELVVSHARGLAWWHILLVPTIGGLAVGLFLHFLVPGGRSKGVPHVIEAMALRNGRMSLREGLIAAVVNFTSLGVGASAGREGPMVHLGASIAGQVAQWLKLSPQMARTLLGCGVAAAVAASFNAPIAGVFFALEVIVGHYALSAFAPVVVASVAGTVISRIHLGAAPAFILPQMTVVSPLEFGAFFLLGIVCALVAGLFMWSIFFTERVLDGTVIPNWLKPAAGGLLIGAMAIYFPHILGVGYEATDAALQQKLPLLLLLLLIPLKTAATAISLGCRFGGGVFSPSLYLGAMTGVAFGIIAGLVFPELATGSSAYGVVGMSAVAAAVLGAPISTILIVFELTADYKITIAVMVATSVATMLVQQTVGHSFFHGQLQNRGLNLQGGRARHLLQALTVRDVLTPDFEPMKEGASAREIRDIFEQLPDSTFVVVDDEERYVGTLAFTDLKHLGFDAALDELINARDIAHIHAPALLIDDTLEGALANMDVSGGEHLAVVDDHGSGRVIGVVHHTEVLRAYNRALMEAQAEEHDENRK
jgi:CIC family chloride channel protein